MDQMMKCKRMLGVLFLLSSSAAAQSTYRDALFTVQVPAGWQANKLQDQPDGVSITKGKAYVNLGVGPGQNGAGRAAGDILADYEKSLGGRCQNFQALNRGNAPVAGAAGAYLMFTCNDPREGSVNLSVAIATSKADVVFFDTGGPAAEYAAATAGFQTIDNSFRLTGGGPAPVAAPQSPAAGGGQLYRDPGGRFTVSIPGGWTAAPQGGGVQISQGSSWMTIGPFAGVARPQDVVDQLQGQFAGQYKNFTRTKAGPFQLNGRAAALGMYEGVNPKGTAVALVVIGVAGPGQTQFAILSSVAQSDEGSMNGAMQSMLNSIQFLGQ